VAHHLGGYWPTVPEVALAVAYPTSSPGSEGVATTYVALAANRHAPRPSLD
jgi:hypothetical protein